MKRILKPLAVFLLLASAILPARSEERAELTLGEAVGAALSRNLSVEEERLLQKVQEAAVLEAKGEFDPVLSAGANASESKMASVTTITSSREETVNVDAALGGKIRTGTEYEIKVAESRVERSATPFLLVNPYYSAESLITVTQPVLKGFGRKVQESAIRAAESDLEAARLRSEHHAMEIIDETATAYWALYFARGAFEAAEISLKLAESTLEEVRAKIEAGALAPVEIYKAEAESAIREENLLSARKAVFDAEDTLRAIMNATEWHAEIVPVEAPPEPVLAPGLDALLDEAFKNRRDLMQARAELRGKEIMERYYKNQMLPELNIVGSAGTNGLGTDRGDAFDNATGGNYYSWTLGLTLEIPLGNRAQKARYLRAGHEVDIAGLRVEEVRQQVTVEVRESLRAVELARESIRASGRSKVASEKRLEAEQERFRLGMATLNDVLQFQQEYADAISSERRAIADYAGSSVSLRRASGTLIYPVAGAAE